MDEWINNPINEYGIPQIVKTLHIGDFVQVIHEDERVFGGFITTIATEAPAIAKDEERIHVLGISTNHPNHNSEELILWASKIKQFRIIHK
jgi:hypothetical protein